MRRVVACVGLSLLLALVGCDGGGGEQQNAKPSESSQGGGGQQSDVQDMRSIPYAGGSEIDEDDEDGVDAALGTRRSKVQPGYTLYSLHMKAKAVLIDLDGNVQRTWEDPGARHWDNIELLPNGDLITTGADPTPEGVSGIVDEKRYAMRLSWDGEVIWKKYLFCHHDIAAAPNDELITLTFQRRQEPSVHAKIDLRDDLITRMTMDGEVIESVSMWDTLTEKPDIYPLEENRPTTMGGRRWIDTFHLNSVEWMDDESLVERHALYGLDNVLFCSRHQDRIAIVDMKKKEVLWAWGQDELDGPHDATVLPGGNILVFDNGLSRGWSRVVELDPTSGEIVWQYFDPRDKELAEKSANPQQRTNTVGKAFYTKSKGSSQRLANGNTLICSSDQGELFEVTSDGEIVWRYTAPERVMKRGKELRAAFVRGYRYPAEFIHSLPE